METLLPQLELSAIVRIKPSKYYFKIWERFRIDSEGNIQLHRFCYSVTESAIDDAVPLFRYECHPDLDDSDDEATDGEVSTSAEDAVIQDSWKPATIRPHGRIPHFHPHYELAHPLRHLHLPFHRDKRTKVVFALIEWLSADLVKRYYDSGRVSAST